MQIAKAFDVDDYNVAIPAAVTTLKCKHAVGRGVKPLTSSEGTTMPQKNPTRTKFLCPPSARPHPDRVVNGQADGNGQ